MTIEDLIRRFPACPLESIYLLVYNEEMVADRKNLVAEIHGENYLRCHVTVKPISQNGQPVFIDHDDTIIVYHDPHVFACRQNGYN